MQEFQSELQIIKRLDHKHVVRYVGSYTDKKDLGLLISPVADCDLATYLQDVSNKTEHYPTLRTFFGCLATALSYLHNNSIKHRDIKPQNILVYRASVLLTDFGLSREFLDTTTGGTPVSPRYCSPEVAVYEARNSSADVWSLGCVFLEMVNCLQGNDLVWLKAFYEDNGTRSTHFHANAEATCLLLASWELCIAPEHQKPLEWIRQMLTAQRNSRPKATQIADDITASEDGLSFMYSCDSCCNSWSDSDSLKSIADTFHQISVDISDLHDASSPSHTLKSDAKIAEDRPEPFGHPKSYTVTPKQNGSDRHPSRDSAYRPNTSNENPWRQSQSPNRNIEPKAKQKTQFTDLNGHELSDAEINRRRDAFGLSLGQVLSHGPYDLKVLDDGRLPLITLEIPRIVSMCCEDVLLQESMSPIFQ